MFVFFFPCLFNFFYTGLSHWLPKIPKSPFQFENKISESSPLFPHILTDTMWLLSWFPPPSHRETVSSRRWHGLFLSFPSAVQAIPPARLPSPSLPRNHFPWLPIFTNIQDSLLPSTDHQSPLPRSWHCFYLDFRIQQLSGCLVFALPFWHLLLYFFASVFFYQGSQSWQSFLPPSLSFRHWKYP